MFPITALTLSHYINVHTIFDSHTTHCSAYRSLVQMAPMQNPMEAFRSLFSAFSVKDSIPPPKATIGQRSAKLAQRRVTRPSALQSNRPTAVATRIIKSSSPNRTVRLQSPNQIPSQIIAKSIVKRRVSPRLLSKARRQLDPSPNHSALPLSPLTPSSPTHGLLHHVHLDNISSPSPLPSASLHEDLRLSSDRDVAFEESMRKMLQIRRKVCFCFSSVCASLHSKPFSFLNSH